MDGVNPRRAWVLHIPTYTLPAGSSPRTLLAVPAVSAFPVPVPFLRCG